MLAEPFAAWAANVFYALGGVQVLQWSDAHHFAQRLTPAKVQARLSLVSRVIRNAENANADPSRDFIIESLGIFGSVLTGSTSPGDVDVVFTARWRFNNRPLPEASYYPFGVSEPTNRVSRALSRGSRRMDLSSHYLLEVRRSGRKCRQGPRAERDREDQCCVDASTASRSFWTSPSTNAGVFPSVRENRSVLTSRAGFMASTPFSVSQENSIRIAAMCCLTVGGDRFGRILSAILPFG
jgi:hypothetical protein